MGGGKGGSQIITNRGTVKLCMLIVGRINVCAVGVKNVRAWVGISRVGKPRDIRRVKDLGVCASLGWAMER